MKISHPSLVRQASRNSALPVAALVLATSLSAGAPRSAEAAFYKCVGADGGVTYSNTQCPSNEQVAKVIEGGASRQALDCRIARNLTEQVAPMVVRGVSPDRTFDRYGGFHALSPTTIGLINYLYSFKHTPDVHPAKISNLAISRCENGSFGPTDCGQFPRGFIDDLGGCEGALVLGGTRPEAMAARRYQPSATYAPATAPHTPAAARSVNQTRYSDNRRDDVEQCRLRVKRKIDDVIQQMRRASSVRYQDELREERHALGRKLSQCSR